MPAPPISHRDTTACSSALGVQGAACRHRNQHVSMLFCGTHPSRYFLHLEFRKARGRRKAWPGSEVEYLFFVDSNRA